jgi:hypothetical protein
MHHEMKFWFGDGTQDPTGRQDCLDRSGIAYEEERASRAVIPSVKWTLLAMVQPFS